MKINHFTGIFSPGTGCKPVWVFPISLFATEPQQVMKSMGRIYLKAHAALRLFAEDLDPSDVTRALELPPDHPHRKGDLRIGRTKRGKVQVNFPYTQGMWSMSSELWVSSPRLHIHIQWILDQIQPKADTLARIVTPAVSASVFCYSLGKCASPPSIPKVLRDQLGDLGLSLEIDHYEISEESQT